MFVGNSKLSWVFHIVCETVHLIAARGESYQCSYADPRLGRLNLGRIDLCLEASGHPTEPTKQPFELKILEVHRILHKHRYFYM